MYIPLEKFVCILIILTDIYNNLSGNASSINYGSLLLRFFKYVYDMYNFIGLLLQNCKTESKQFHLPEYTRTVAKALGGKKECVNEYM